MLCPLPPDSYQTQKPPNHVPPFLQKSPSTPSASRWFLRNSNKVLLPLQRASIFSLQTQQILATATKDMVGSINAIISYLVEATGRSNWVLGFVFFVLFWFCVVFLGSFLVLLRVFLHFLTWWKQQLAFFALLHFYCSHNGFPSTDRYKYQFCQYWKTQVTGWEPRVASWHETRVCLSNDFP